MRKLKRPLAGGAVAALLAAAAMAAPAAAADVKLTCTITGTMKVVDKVDSNLGMRLVGGKGQFRFNDPADPFTWDCAGMEKGVPSKKRFDMTASGWYFNRICRTSKAVGEIDAVDADMKIQNLLEGRKFALEFASGVGTFHWHEWAKETPDVKLTPEDDWDKPMNEKDWEAAGAIALSESVFAKTLDPPNLAAGECTKALFITGEVVIHF